MQIGAMCACRIRAYFYSFYFATHGEMCIMINHVMSILYSKKSHLNFSTLNTEVRINGKSFPCFCVSADSLVPLSILSTHFLENSNVLRKPLLLCNNNTENQHH